jgi:hypothetical protein
MATITTTTEIRTEQAADYNPWGSTTQPQTVTREVTITRTTGIITAIRPASFDAYCVTIDGEHEFRAIDSWHVGDQVTHISEDGSKGRITRACPDCGADIYTPANYPTNHTC